MKRNTKGFTLIELLAVIVILAIIALIATPIVLNLINKAREGAAKDSTYGLKKSAQLYYQTKLIDNPETGLESNVTISFNSADSSEDTYYTNYATDGFQVDGTKPSAGTITITTTGDISASGLVFGANTCAIATGTGAVSCS